MCSRSLSLQQHHHHPSPLPLPHLARAHLTTHDSPARLHCLCTVCSPCRVCWLRARSNARSLLTPHKARDSFPGGPTHCAALNQPSSSPPPGSNQAVPRPGCWVPTVHRRVSTVEHQTRRTVDRNALYALHSSASAISPLGIAIAMTARRWWVLPRGRPLAAPVSVSARSRLPSRVPSPSPVAVRPQHGGQLTTTSP